VNEVIENLQKHGKIYRLGLSSAQEATMMPAIQLPPEVAFATAVTLQHQQYLGHRVPLALYGTLSSHNPHHFATYFNMGTGLQYRISSQDYADGDGQPEKGLVDGALIAYEHAHRINPTHVFPMLSLMEMYTMAHAVQKVVTMREKLMAAHPDLASMITPPAKQRQTKRQSHPSTEVVSTRSGASVQPEVENWLRFVAAMYYHEVSQYENEERIWAHLTSKSVIKRWHDPSSLHVLFANHAQALQRFGNKSGAQRRWIQALKHIQNPRARRRVVGPEYAWAEYESLTDAPEGTALWTLWNWTGCLIPDTRNMSIDVYRNTLRISWQ